MRPGKRSHQGVKEPREPTLRGQHGSLQNHWAWGSGGGRTGGFNLPSPAPWRQCPSAAHRGRKISPVFLPGAWAWADGNGHYPTSWPAGVGTETVALPAIPTSAVACPSHGALQSATLFFTRMQAGAPNRCLPTAPSRAGSANSRRATKPPPMSSGPATSSG